MSLSISSFPRELVWPLTPFDGERVEVTPLSATLTRLTFRISSKDEQSISAQFPFSNIVIKWCVRKKLAELDLNKRFQSGSFVPLLGGGVLINASLEQVIPGLTSQQYSKLCTQIKAITVGATVLRKSDNKLSGYPVAQDIIIQKFMIQQSFSPSKAKGSPGSWKSTRERLATTAERALKELDEEGLVHADLRGRNMFMDEDDFCVGDLGSVRKRKRRGEPSELSVLLRDVDEIREEATGQLSPKKGAYSERSRSAPRRFSFDLFPTASVPKRLNFDLFPTAL